MLLAKRASQFSRSSEMILLWGANTGSRFHFCMISDLSFGSSLTSKLLGSHYSLGLGLTPSLKELQKWKGEPTSFRKAKLLNVAMCLLSLSRYSHFLWEAHTSV